MLTLLRQKDAWATNLEKLLLSPPCHNNSCGIWEHMEL